MTNNTEIFHIIDTTRAMRRLKPDPVPDNLIKKILQAGFSAPNGGNAQKWKFMVIKDMEIKKQIQVLYKRAFDEVVSPSYAISPTPPGATRDSYNRQNTAVEYLTEHYHEAPVWIIPCIEHGDSKVDRTAGASIYPAVQNMLLAARALGLGSTLTTRYLMHEKEAEEILGLPNGVHSYAILPIGYPIGNFGPVGRGNIEDFVYIDKWGDNLFN